MAIELFNNSDSSKVYKLKNGYFLVPKDTLSQRMLSTKSLYVEMPPQSSRKEFLFAMCSQHFKGSPIGDYTLGELANDSLVRIAGLIERDNWQNRVGQAAVWAFTDYQTSISDQFYVYDTIEVEQVKKLLIEARINREF